MKSQLNVISILFVLLLVAAAAHGQSGQIISFDDLLKRNLPQKFAWVNPDSTKEEIEFSQLQIPVDDQVKDLTRKFMVDNYARNSIWVEPRMIVIHSMDLDDLQASLEQSSFLDRRMPASWTTVVKAGELPSGAHFIIDRDGKIFCLTPPYSKSEETKVSYDRSGHKWLVRRHVDAVPIAIGIENVTARDGSFTDLTDAQVNSNALLVRWLMWMEGGSVKYLMSHHQFNDSTRFANMLKEFSLTPPRPIYRAWNRQDVGDAVLQRILSDVRKRGWTASDDF